MHPELKLYSDTLPPDVYNMDPAGKPTPGFFHYTTYSGLLGIVDSGTLWATNIHHLNDYTEFSHAIELARGVLLGRRMRENLPESLLDYVSNLGRIENLNIYVACFCENGDLLSQWRGYSGGSGVSIGFRYDELAESAELQGFHILKCIYDNSTKMRYIENMIDCAIRTGGNDPAQVMDRFIKEFLKFAPAFKHEAFSEEREWRLVSAITPTYHPQICFRATCNALVPYFAFDLNQPGRKDERGRQILSIGQVVIGPGRDEKRPDSVTNLFARKNLRWFSIMPSTAPYRSTQSDSRF